MHGIFIKCGIETRDNEEQVRSGWNDPKLSLKGYEQAERLRDQFAGMQFDAIFTSDLQRTICTAQIAFPNGKRVSDSRLREMNYGVLNGGHDTSFPEDDTWCIENRFELGENCLDVQARITDLLDELYDPSRNIAIFSHKYPQLAIEVILNDLSWPQGLEQDWRHKGELKPGWIYDSRLTYS